MSAIKAEYVNLKHVKSRDAYQIILEVPAETAMNVIEVLGLPASHQSKWVGVALLTEDSEDDADQEYYDANPETPTA